MKTRRLRNFAIGFFTGASLSYLSMLVFPKVIAAALVIGTILLLAGLGVYTVFLVQSLTDPRDRHRRAV
jgi:hypothetical protein